MKSLDLNTMVHIVEEMAKQQTDGHISILKFTTGWKAFFGTTNLDIGGDRERIARMPAFETLEGALQNLIINKIKID